MTDIVKLLRVLALAAEANGHPDVAEAENEAADEIERLRKRNAALEAELRKWIETSDAIYATAFKGSKP